MWATVGFEWFGGGFSMRTFVVHQIRSGFVLVLLIDSRPRGSLTCGNEAELVAVGQEWINPTISACNRAVLGSAATHKIAEQCTWNGVERRKSSRFLGRSLNVFRGLV